MQIVKKTINKCEYGNVRMIITMLISIYSGDDVFTKRETEKKFNSNDNFMMEFKADRSHAIYCTELNRNYGI